MICPELVDNLKTAKKEMEIMLIAKPLLFPELEDVPTTISLVNIWVQVKITKLRERVNRWTKNGLGSTPKFTPGGRYRSLAGAVLPFSFCL